MFGLRRKKRKEYDPMPPWLKWGVLAFLILAITTNAFKDKDEKGMTFGPAGTVLNNKQTRVNWNLLDTDQYGALYSNKADALRRTILKRGNGEKPICGQQAKIKYAYKVIIPETQVPTPGFERPEIPKEELSGGNSFTYRFGQDKMHPVLDITAEKMRVGETVKVDVPSGWSKGQAYPTEYTITLESLTPPLVKAEKNAMNLKVFNRNTTPLGLRCGESAQFHFTFHGIEGKKLFSTLDSDKPITVTLGKTPMMQGLIRAMAGMIARQSITALLPPHEQSIFVPTRKERTGKNAKDKKFIEKKMDNPVQPLEILPNFTPPAGQVLIVEIERLPPVEEIPSPNPSPKNKPDKTP